MSYLRCLAFCSLLLALHGCGNSVHAATTRVLDTDSAALSSTPICFVQPSPELNLTQRAEQTNILAICEDAARKEGVRVVSFDNASCLAATLVWSTRNTGEWVGDCSRTLIGSECEGSSIHAKSVKVILTRPTTGKVIAESTAAIHSDHGGFSQKSFHALCTAAFHDFPLPLSNARFDVSIE
jgi:hypothetical protein